MYIYIYTCIKWIRLTRLKQPLCGTPPAPGTSRRHLPRDGPWFPEMVRGHPGDARTPWGSPGEPPGPPLGLRGPPPPDYLRSA